MDCDAQMAATCLFMPTFWQVLLIHIIGRTDLDFGVQSGFFGRSVHARLQVSVCSGYICSTMVNIQTHTETATYQLI